MMKLQIAIFGLLLCNLAIPTKADSIVKYVFDQNDKGYNFNFETEDKAKKESFTHEATSTIVQKGDKQVNVVKGSYLITNDEYNYLSVEYTADENGYRPKIKWIPRQKARVPPPKDTGVGYGLPVAGSKKSDAAKPDISGAALAALLGGNKSG